MKHLDFISIGFYGHRNELVHTIENVPYYETVHMPTDIIPTLEGYTFYRWGNLQGTSISYIIMPNEDVNIYATCCILFHLICVRSKIIMYNTHVRVIIIKNIQLGPGHG